MNPNLLYLQLSRKQSGFEGKLSISVCQLLDDPGAHL
jgi:hypothetical protein